jgi:methyl-accepting chemotaxis protein
MTITDILVLVILIWIVNKFIIKPIQELNQRAQDLATGNGDLTKRIDIDSNDEIGKVAKYINIFISKVQDIINSIINALKNITITTKKVSQKVVNAVKKQDKLISDTKEKAKIVQTNIENTKETVIQTNETLSTTNETIKNLISYLNDIASKLQENVQK